MCTLVQQYAGYELSTISAKKRRKKGNFKQIIFLSTMLDIDLDEPHMLLRVFSQYDLVSSIILHFILTDLIKNFNRKF